MNNFTLSNLTLTGRKLIYDYKKPFDVLANMGSCKVWLPKVNILRTNYYEEIVSYHEFVDMLKLTFKLVV